VNLARTAFFIARKDLRYMLRQRETLLWTFLMPIVFFYFIGAINGGFGSSGGASKDPLILDRSPEAGFLADQLTRRLEQADFRIVPPESVATDSKVPRLAIPAAFTDSVLAGHPMTLTLTRQEEDLGGRYYKVRVQRAAYAVLGDLIAVAEKGETPDPPSLAAMADAPRPLKLEVQRAGLRKKSPSGFDQAVPGTMVMFTLLVMLTSGAVLLVIERKEGLLRRLASSPLPRSGIILGKWGGRFGLGLVQLAFAMIAGSLLFRVDWGPHLVTLLVVLAVYASLVAMLGIVLGNLSRSEGQAVGIGVLAANVLAALGGCWWPIEIAPSWMQHLALFLPTGWAMDALHKLVNFGYPPTAVIGHLVVMVVATAGIGWAAVRTFRFQ
jgi:ABC-2 type transport system permease protein